MAAAEAVVRTRGSGYPTAALGVYGVLLRQNHVTTDLEALRGAPGPLSVRLNLGPGDGPYVRAFAPEYEIDERVATHWTRSSPTENARIMSGSAK